MLRSITTSLTKVGVNLLPKAPVIGVKTIHTSSPRLDLMEFFDAKENWNKDKIRVGRSWKTDELRLKSNEDLHKLWFILLKERNMLLTMLHAYKDACQHMPNEERLDKVDESMENLEEVVRERNRAFYELEVGGTGEQEREIVIDRFGLRSGYTMREYPMPVWNHPEFRKFIRYRCRTGYNHTVLNFYRRYREKMFNTYHSARRRQFMKAAGTLKRFPNTKKEALEEWFPLVKYDEVIRFSKAKGNHWNGHIDAPE